MSAAIDRTRAGTRRFPLEPLLRLTHQSSPGLAALACGFTARTGLRWAVAGVSVSGGDQAALHLGLHPANIWPEWAER